MLLVDVMSEVGELSVTMRTRLGLAGAGAAAGHWLPSKDDSDWSNSVFCGLIGQHTCAPV